MIKSNMSNIIQNFFDIQFDENKIAIVYGKRSITYGELLLKVKSLSKHIKNVYNKNYHSNDLTDKVIALLIPRGIEQIIVILAVWASGGAYLPINHDTPRNRINDIINDAKPDLFITYKTDIFDIYQEKCIKLDDFVFGDIDDYTLPNIPITALAYVIYTSGTTGKPKGVMIEHLGLLNIINYVVTKYNMSFDEKSIVFAKYTFDTFIEQSFCGLLSGITIHIVDDDLIADPLLFGNYIAREGISHLHVTPSYLNYLEVDSLQYLRRLVVAAEKFSEHLFKRFSSKINEIYNLYGPTECSIICTEAKNKTSIGRFITNCYGFILDENLQLVEDGGVGELYIAGDCLARGYLNNEILTNQKFINININGELQRCYKSGDLCYIADDGDLYYINRIDNQIKIRGYRVELSEIEAIVNNIPEIQNSCAVYHNDNIILFYISSQITIDYLESYLKSYLPDYMIPATFLRVDKFSQNDNNKVDKKSLLASLTQQKNIILPRNELERYICNSFFHVLNIPEDHISIEDDFFQLGGNSINLAKLVRLLNKVINISYQDVFKRRTIAAISKNAILKTELINNSDINDYFTNVHKLKSNVIKETNLSKQFPNDCSPAIVNKLLITGATGFLGIHILTEYLLNTNAKIILLLRKSDDLKRSNYNRLKSLLQQYTQIDLDIFKDRIVIYYANLKSHFLGLTQDLYNSLFDIDCIIHCAANVKHFGNETDFYLDNVEVTINLLELCKKTQSKNFAYISTTSVLQDTYSTTGANYFKFNEFSTIHELNFINPYAKSKYLGEQKCWEYVHKYGVKLSIFRAGNLFCNSQTKSHQENVSNNAFISIVAGVIKLKSTTNELNRQEVTHVDHAAKCIFQIIKNVGFSNNIYHVYNNNYVYLDHFLSAYGDKINVLSTEDYLNLLDFTPTNPIIEHFRINAYGFLTDKIVDNPTLIHVSSDETVNLLQKFGFTWPVHGKSTYEELIDVVKVFCQNFK